MIDLKTVCACVVGGRTGWCCLYVLHLWYALRLSINRFLFFNSNDLFWDCFSSFPLLPHKDTEQGTIPNLLSKPTHHWPLIIYLSPWLEIHTNQEAYYTDTCSYQSVPQPQYYHPSLWLRGLKLRLTSTWAICSDSLLLSYSDKLSVEHRTKQCIWYAMTHRPLHYDLLLDIQISMESMSVLLVVVCVI